MIGNAADQKETAVAITAIDEAIGRIDLQPHARMAERGTGNVARPHAGNAGTVGADGFWRSNHGGAIIIATLVPQWPRHRYR